MQHADAEAVVVFAFKFRGYWLCSTSRCSSATSSLSPLSQAETPSELFFCVYSPALIENTIRLVATSPPGIQCLRLVSHKMGTAEGLNEVQEVQEVGSCYFNVLLFQWQSSQGQRVCERDKEEGVVSRMQAVMKYSFMLFQLLFLLFCHVFLVAFLGIQGPFFSLFF